MTARASTRSAHLLTDGKISPADLRDVEAYAEAMQRAGVKVLDIERTVVNDELGVAGRLDRTVMVRLPGAQRATRMVGDIKTGRLDFGAGQDRAATRNVRQ
jgi:hypothetical protein